MKKRLKQFLHKMLGFRQYLFIFSIYKIFTLRYDKYEKDFFKFLELIPENPTLLDIGANIGIMTVIISKKCHNSTIYSFEPLPQNFSTLERIVKLFRIKRVTLFDLALGDENKTIELILPIRDSVFDQGRVHVVEGSISEEGVKITAKQKRLDDITEIKDVQIDAVKIDVENHEFFLFKGGMNTFLESKPIIFCEVWPNEKKEKTFELIKEWGYGIFYNDNGELKPALEATSDFDQFIFIHKDNPVSKSIS